MKTWIVVALASLAFCSVASANEPVRIECRVYKMADHSYFEEGLSADEYPSIDVAYSSEHGWSVEYGSHEAYSAKEGYKVTVEQHQHGEFKRGILVTSVSEHGDVVTLEIERRTKLAKARIRVREEKDSRAHTVGYALCTPGILEDVNP